MGCLLDHCWVCNRRCVSRGHHRCGSCQVPQHLSTGPLVRQDCLRTQSRAGAGSPGCVRICRQDHGLWVCFQGHGWAWLLLPPLAVGLCVVQSVRHLVGLHGPAFSKCCPWSQASPGFLSYLPGSLSSHKSLEFPLLSVDGGQIVVCVGACEPGPLIPQSCCCCAVCSQHSIQKDPGLWQPQTSVLLCSTAESSLSSQRPWRLLVPQLHHVFDILSYCFVSLATLASWLVFEHESCSYPGAFEHGVSFSWNTLSRYLHDRSLPVPQISLHILSQQDDSIRNFSPLTSIFSNLIPCFILNISSVPYILLVYLYCPLLLPLECKKLCKTKDFIFFTVVSPVPSIVPESW